jgi:hypothetical protein
LPLECSVVLNQGMEHVYNRFMQLAISEILDELFVEYIFSPHLYRFCYLNEASLMRTSPTFSNYLYTVLKCKSHIYINFKGSNRTLELLDKHKLRKTSKRIAPLKSKQITEVDHKTNLIWNHVPQPITSYNEKFEFIIYFLFLTKKEKVFR